VNPSTSGSERNFTRVAAWSFTLLLGAMTVSYELLVRASETRYGLTYKGLGSGQSSKIETLVRSLGEGKRYSTYALGTSRTEEGIRSDVMAAAVGSTFNLGISGASLVSGLETLELLDERPSLVIAGVCPMDFTGMSVRRGSAMIKDKRGLIASFRNPKDQERGPAATARAMTYSLLHGAAPPRKRNFGQWRQLAQMHGDVLRFLNNPDATIHQDDLWIDGFLGVPTVATPRTFVLLLPTSTLLEYHEKHEFVSARLQEAVARQRSRGTEVVFVRLPIAPVPRQLEDAAGFDRDIRAVAVRCGVRYVDGNTLTGDTFIHDRRNFRDGGHLNVTGATAFSRLLGEALRQQRVVRKPPLATSH
jgi:hypothetical protein